MKGLFPYAWEAVENTQRIADRCNVEIEFGVTKLPKYDVPEGYDSWSYLNKLCNDGLAERYGDGDQPAGETDRPCGNVWITSWVSSAEWDMWTIS